VRQTLIQGWSTYFGLFFYLRASLFVGVPARPAGGSLALLCIFDYDKVVLLCLLEALCFFLGLLVPVAHKIIKFPGI
jgi:hypothetical protein